MSTVKINVNKAVHLDVKKGSTILEAITQAQFPYMDIEVPTLYYLKGVVDVDDSGVCIVERRQRNCERFPYPCQRGYEYRDTDERSNPSEKRSVGRQSLQNMIKTVWIVCAVTAVNSRTCYINMILPMSRQCRKRIWRNWICLPKF